MSFKVSFSSTVKYVLSVLLVLFGLIVPAFIYADSGNTSVFMLSFTKHTQRVYFENLEPKKTYKLECKLIQAVRDHYDVEIRAYSGIDETNLQKQCLLLDTPEAEPCILDDLTPSNNSKIVPENNNTIEFTFKTVRWESAVKCTFSENN